jgi:nitrite reductase/ring-hydroxylating ferredoxin subunit
MRILAVAFIGLFLVACGKRNDVVPYVPVNITIQKSDPRFNTINTPGSTITIGGGVAGIILSNSGNGIVAFDRCSTYQPEKACAITVDAGLLSATDPCSGAKFSLVDGSPVKAPATRSLRSYSVIITQFEIKIVN